MKVIYRGKKLLAGNIYTFSFEAPKKMPYIAGQFIEMHLSHKQPDNRGDKRWFTLSSAPSEELFQITTRLVAAHRSSFKNALFSLQPGTEVSISSAMGDFVLPKDRNLPLLFIAGGIGCTPFRSMIKNLLDHQEMRQITLIHSVSDTNELIFSDIFEEIPTYFPVTGKRLSTTNILQQAGDIAKQTLIYVSGPEQMVEQLKHGLVQAGIDKRKIHTDSFPGYDTLVT